MPALLLLISIFAFHCEVHFCYTENCFFLPKRSGELRIFPPEEIVIGHKLSFTEFLVLNHFFRLEDANSLNEWSQMYVYSQVCFGIIYSSFTVK